MPLTTLLTAALLIAVAALAIAILPWSRSEIDASWAAWSLLAGLAGKAWSWLREAPSAPVRGARSPS